MREYEYLVSTLPRLILGAAPPFSREAFLSLCRDHLDDADLRLLATITITPELKQGRSAIGARSAVYLRYLHFEVSLRGELVRLRSARRGVVPGAQRSILQLNSGPARGPLERADFRGAVDSDATADTDATAPADPAADATASADAVAVARAAFAQESPLSAEETLDRARFAFLEDVSFGHYFDVEVLVVYLLKLQLIAKGSRRTPEIGSSEFTRAYEAALTKTLQLAGNGGRS